MYNKYIGMEISKLSNMMKRSCKKDETDKTEDEITSKNGWIIGYIAENKDKDIFQKDIEKKFLIRRSTVSGILQLMEKKGYILRESVNHDARLKKLTLTNKSWDYLNRTMEKIDENETILRSGLSDEEINTLFAILDKIKNNIDA